ncbi:MAG: hypothetical protein M1833_003547 [Piccolia ochrophora]|nr:MAG: hypothetical protein M1833_003547 [Piccolia ochrophora]
MAATQHSVSLTNTMHTLNEAISTIESQTGMSAFDWAGSPQAAATEYERLAKEAHRIEGQMLYLERMVEFQIRGFPFLRDQYEWIMQAFFAGASAAPDRYSEELKERPDNRSSTFEMLISYATERLQQIRDMTAQNDTRTNIAIAEQSRRIAAEAKRDSSAMRTIAEQSKRIAVETKRDSSAMKTIAAVTMVFLPATFVATFFSMVFFHVGSETTTNFTVNSNCLVKLVALEVEQDKP